jgi:dTDP-4-dehydrorhamnose 3,5-epimerase
VGDLRLKAIAPAQGWIRAPQPADPLEAPGRPVGDPQRYPDRLAVAEALVVGSGGGVLALQGGDPLQQAGPLGVRRPQLSDLSPQALQRLGDGGRRLPPAFGVRLPQERCQVVDAVRESNDQFGDGRRILDGWPPGRSRWYRSGCRDPLPSAAMQVTTTALEGVLILNPVVHGDARGFFMEAWNARTFAELVDPEVSFVQDNASRSGQGVIRGLHYQNPHPQGKLVRCMAGEVFDVAVDIRASSPTFGRWLGVELSADNHRQLWIPPGFAHGFAVRSEFADVEYKVTDFYAPGADRAIAWNDPAIGVDWGIDDPVVSAKDAAAPPLAEALLYD